MNSILKNRLAKALELTEVLCGQLVDPQLAFKMDSSRSNSIGLQFWCVAGARESYVRAFAASAWQGFSCSLSRTDLEKTESISTALRSSRLELLALIEDLEESTIRASILFDLLEHEVQHHGQLIRFFYANGIDFPGEFARRYSLS